MLPTKTMSKFIENNISRKKIGLLAFLCMSALCLIALQRDNPVFTSISSLAGQPFHVAADNTLRGALLLEMDYSAGQNATLEIEPYLSCVTRIFVSQVIVPATPVTTIPLKAPLCQDISHSANQVTLDFSPYLKNGHNILTFDLISNHSYAEIYISPQLFGADIPSTLACLGLFILAASLLFLIARKSGLSTASAVILIAGLGYFSLWLHLRPNLAYTNDIYKHITYIRYLLTQWMRPYEYNGGESLHPPFYYWVAACIYSLFNAPGLINPLTALRVFSLALYLTFCIYGLRTLRESVAQENFAYYAGCLLLVFWPVGMIMATRINNDIALYAAWAATFYYLARGYRMRDLSCLCIAIALTGLTLMIKSNGYVLAGLTGSCIVYASFAGRIAWQQMIKSKNGILAFAFLLLSIMVNIGRLIYKKTRYGVDETHLHFGFERNNSASFYHFVYFDIRDFVLHPFVTFSNEPSFLNYFLKTMLYGEFTWQYPDYLILLPGAINLILLAFLIITFCGIALTLAQNHSRFGDLLPYFAGVLIPLMGVAAFMIAKHWVVCQDFRYALPMLIPLVILFVRGIESIRITFGSIAYRTGIGISLCLPLGGIILYLGQYVH